MNSQQRAQQHLMIIITIVIGFSFFMMGYSYPPFIEVGFGDAQALDAGTDGTGDAELMKQYEDLYNTDNE